MSFANSHPYWNQPQPARPVRPRFRRLRANLQAGALGDRQRLFEVREELAELSRTVSQGPWSPIAAICVSLEMILRHCLRKGSLGLGESAEVASELIDFVEQALATPPPSAPAQPVAQPVAAAPPPVHPEPHAGPVQAPPAQPWPVPPQASAPAGDASLAARGLRAGLDADGMQSVNESRLGELLIRMGRLDAAQLSRALVMQKVSRKRLGEALVLMGAVDPGDLNDALLLQREETLRLAGGM